MHPVVSEDGTVTYPGDAQVPSVNVSAEEDATRISTVITDVSQTEVFDYDFGAGAAVEVQGDGSTLYWWVDADSGGPCR